jgi:hypothetical protein
MLDGSILILDYKTGSVESKPQDISGIENSSLSREYIRDHVRSFQMPLYAHYLRRQFPGAEISSAFYNLRTMSMDMFLCPPEGYFKALDFIMEEIFNLEIPFVDDPVDII